MVQLAQKKPKTSSPQHRVPLPEPKPKPKSGTSMTPETTVESAKKRADLRSKVKSRGVSGSKGTSGYVLGGADYVTLMMGGRRRVAEEALKLPPKDS
ncbi:hypothetical protein V8B97DRAFT_560730 [Scleroderma yunnanense]